MQRPKQILKRNAKAIVPIAIDQPTKTLEILTTILPRDIARMIDRYFRPIDANMFDIMWSGYYELCELACDQYKGRVDCDFAIEAVKPGQIDILRLIMSKFTTINIYPAIYYACAGGYRDIVDLILPTMERPPAYTTLIDAVRKGYFDIAELLIARGTSASDALRSACKSNDLEVINWLFPYAKPYNDSRYDKLHTPANYGLTMACYHNSVEAARLMLEKGATCLNVGLRVACAKDSFGAINLMLDYGATQCSRCNCDANIHRRSNVSR